MSLTFGPIPSRRFGMSLGINLSANIKQCNFDCLYCELKPAKTITQQIISSKVENIIVDVKNSIKLHPNINVITLTANGEPTLYPYLEKLIYELDKIKGNMKTLILSNAGNIYDNDIQQILTKVDIVKLSLDCVSEKCFKKLDRIDKSINCNKIVEGIIKFRKLYTKELIIETLFVKNINDNDNEVQLLNNILQKINPNRVDIGTIDRPPAYDAQSISFESLNIIALKLDGLPVNIIYKKRPKSIQSFTRSEIINLIKMRPLTQEDIENTFDNDSIIILDKIVKHKIITIKNNGGVNFYYFAS
jgi:wyosine [tRNA(Phe)-imidazoG37] synthetase (radical SAM superfamily)